jgi:glucosamine--fructose-6-phosphate aminotransferase (isomerizing)
MKYWDELNRTPEILSRIVGTVPDAPLVEASLVVFCGCGTSFYIAGQLANLCTEHGKNARAVEAVEIIESSVPIEIPGSVFVFISRSGDSLETVIAARQVIRAGIATFYLGCTENSTLDRECDRSRVIGFAREALALESYSYSAQILCLSLLCNVAREPEGIPTHVEDALRTAERVFRAHFLQMDIARIIFLGASFYMPFLKEMRLKSGEITQKCSEVWGTLEFRHGPRSWADARCLVVVVPGIKTYKYDRKVAEELLNYGSAVIWIGTDPVQGAVNLAWPAPKYSVEEILTLSALLTGLAAEIGESCGIDAAHLSNLDYSVREL